MSGAAKAPFPLADAANPPTARQDAPPPAAADYVDTLAGTRRSQSAGCSSLRGFPQELHRRPSSNCGCSAPGGTRRPPRHSSDRLRRTFGIPRSAAAYSPTEDAPLRADAACTSESAHENGCRCRECRRWCSFPAKNPADAQNRLHANLVRSASPGNAPLLTSDDAAVYAFWDAK